MKRSKTITKKIRDLEQRLIYLKKKYDQLTNQLETERKISSSSEGELDYQQVIQERLLIEKYMQKLTNQLDEREETPDETSFSGKIRLGNNILLVNSSTTLKFRLVKVVFSQEENQISISSPIGKAILGRRVGEDIKVDTPKGKIHYKIKKVE